MGKTHAAIQRRGGARRLVRRRAGERGATAVEFVIAIVPILLMLTCFAEVMRKQCANLMLQYSASVGVRAASVLVNANPNVQGNRNLVDQAVNAALGRWSASTFYSQLSVSSQIASTQGDPNAMDTVTVRARYVCAVPLARHIMCPAASGLSVVQASFPHQGALYIP